MVLHLLHQQSEKCQHAGMTRTLQKVNPVVPIALCVMSQPASGDWFRIAELTQDAESQTTSLPLQDAEVQMGLQSQDAQIQTLSSNKAPSMVFGGVGLLAGAACMGAAWWWHAKRGWDVTHVSTPETDTDIKPAEAGMRKKNQRADESSGLSGAASTHAEDSAPRGPCCTALQPAEASKPNLPQCLDGGSIQDLQSLDEGSALWGAASTHAEHSALRGPCCTARQPAEASMQHPPQSLDERSAVSGAAGKHTEDATASWAWKAWTQRLGISPLGAALQPPPFPEVDDPLLMVGVGATCFVAAAVLARRQRRPMMGVLRQVEKVDARLNAFAGQAQHDHQSFDQQLSQVSQKMDAVHKLLQQERSLEIQTIRQKHESEIQALNTSMEDKLQKQQKDAADEIKRQQDRHEEASKVAQDVQAQHEDTTAQLAAARNELHRKTESEMEAAQLASQYQQAVAALQKEGQMKQDELADAQGKLQQALEEEKRAKDAASGDQAALRLAQAAREKAEKLAETKESETQAVRAELDEAMKKYEEANKEREQCKKEISQLESDLAKSQQTMREEIEKWKTALDVEKHKHESEIQALNASMEDKLQKQQKDAADEIKRQQDRHEEASKVAQDVQAQHEDTTAQLAAARNELHRKTESEMEAAQLASQYQQVVAALQKEGQRKQDELADAKGKLQQALEEEKCAKDAASGDQAALRLAQAAREKAEKLAETKESETQAARAELDEAMKKYEEANKEREQCKKDISQLESDLEKSQQSMHEEIEKWKTALDDERDAAKQQNDAAEQRLSAARENVEQKQKDLDDAKEALRQADESKEESEQKLKDAEEKHESARKDFLKKIDKLEKDWKEARKDSQARAAELKELKAELQVAKGILQVAQSAHLGESDKAWEGALWHAEQYLEGAVAKEYVEKAASCLPVVWAWTENTDLVQKHDADLQQPNDMVLYSASVSRSLESQYLLWHASKQAEKWSELCVDVGRKIWMEHTGTKYNIFFRDMRQVNASPSVLADALLLGFNLARTGVNHHNCSAWPLLPRPPNES